MLRPPKFGSVGVLSLFCGVGVALVMVGCASIMHGTSQGIGIGSSPTGASVIVDGQPLGKTPVVAKLPRKKSHIVRIEMDGYQPFEAPLSKQVSGWVWGNIVFGGIPGLLIDAITGGLYKLNPEQVQAEMKSQGVGARIEGDAVFIAVTLRPREGMQKVGQMERDSTR